MKKVLVVISIIFIIAASVVLISTLAASGWNFEKMFKPAKEASYDISHDFNNVSILVDTTDIRFVKSEGDTVRVECVEAYKVTHSASVEDGTLKIERCDKRRWFEFLTIIPVDFKVTVYLPEGEWGDLIIKCSTGNTEIPQGFTFKSIDIDQSTGNVSLSASAVENMSIKTSTGSIYVSGISSKDASLEASTGNITANDITAASLSMEVSTGKITASNVTLTGDLDVETSTGDTNLNNVRCKNLRSEGDTGYADMTSVVASERFSVERSTGDVKLDGCDGAEIYITTDTGSVKGTLLSDKIIFATSDTGRIDVPKCTTGGRCEIETDTGDIEISIK